MDPIIIIFAILTLIFILLVYSINIPCGLIFTIGWLIIFIFIPTCTVYIPDGTHFMESKSYGYTQTTILPPGNYLKLPTTNVDIISIAPNNYPITITTQTSDHIPITYTFYFIDIAIKPQPFQSHYNHNMSNFITQLTPTIQSTANSYFHNIHSRSIYYNWQSHQDNLQSILSSKFAHLESQFIRNPDNPYPYNSLITWGNSLENLYLRESQSNLFNMANSLNIPDNTQKYPITTTQSKSSNYDYDDMPDTEPTINPNIPQTYGTQEDIDDFVMQLMVKEGRLNPNYSMNRSWYITHPAFYDEWNTENPADPLLITVTPTPTPTQIPNSILCNNNICTST